MISPIKWNNDIIINEKVYVEAHISDIHMGAMEAKLQYEILEEQFISKLLQLETLDIISINGDLFHHRYMANSDAVMYAIRFVNRLVELFCRRLGTTLIIIDGTLDHDDNQNKMFYHFMEDKTIDVRVIENVQIEYIKGKKVLCIPELYGKGKEYYEEFLYTQSYDSVYMHGTLQGTIFGKIEENLDSNREPVFSINNFINCKGPIISGHNHVPGCHNGHFYYCGSPYRWRFGEEEEKGYIILLHNTASRQYYIHYEWIKSFRYDTVNLDHMLSDDPKNIIQYVENLQANGIDNIRLEFTIDDKDTLDLLKDYYRNTRTVKLHIDSANRIPKEVAEKSERCKEYDFIFDKTLNEYEIVANYINKNKGHLYITAEEVKTLVLSLD